MELEGSHELLVVSLRKALPTFNNFHSLNINTRKKYVCRSYSTSCCRVSNNRLRTTTGRSWLVAQPSPTRTTQITLLVCSSIKSLTQKTRLVTLTLLGFYCSSFLLCWWNRQPHMYTMLPTSMYKTFNVALKAAHNKSVTKSVNENLSLVNKKMIHYTDTCIMYF